MRNPQGGRAGIEAQHEIERRDLYPVAANLLGAVERLVGFSKHRGHVDHPIRRDCDTDAQGRSDRPAVHLLGSGGKSGADVLRYRRGSLLVGVVENCGEFLAAEAPSTSAGVISRLAVSAKICSTRSPAKWP